jgi:hypothetical protein
MQKKEKFKLEITRVKLNPEQAVLACCFTAVATSGSATPCAGGAAMDKTCGKAAAGSGASS